MISEAFPVGVKSAGRFVATVVNLSSNVGVTSTRVFLFQFLTPAGVFFAYLTPPPLRLIFVKNLVPETKGNVGRDKDYAVTVEVGEGCAEHPRPRQPCSEDAMQKP
mmetsp:Transcript_120725/g.240426  ORF Transcript_120725/g.240426 Transcript_120725/m.240426 type:complete len:106 (-) Transcript_120725:254-571(-)